MFWFPIVPNQTKGPEAVLHVPVTPEGRCQAQFATAPQDNVSVYPTATDWTAAAAEQVNKLVKMYSKCDFNPIPRTSATEREGCCVASKQSIVAIYNIVKSRKCRIPFLLFV